MDGQSQDVVAWSIIVGIVLPYVLALFNQPTMSGTWKRVIAVAGSILTGAGTAWVNGAFDNLAANRMSILAAIATVFVACQATYAQFAKPVAKTIEVATSPAPDPGGGEVPGAGGSSSYPA